MGGKGRGQGHAHTWVGIRFECLHPVSTHNNIELGFGVAHVCDVRFYSVGKSVKALSLKVSTGFFRRRFLSRVGGPGCKVWDDARKLKLNFLIGRVVAKIAHSFKVFSEKSRLHILVESSSFFPSKSWQPWGCDARRGRGRGEKPYKTCVVQRFLAQRRNPVIR